MSSSIQWNRNFYQIFWAYEKNKMVVSPVFEDKKDATQLAKQVENWSDKFTRMTIIEMKNGEYAICIYQDPQISKSSNIGLYRSGMPQISGYSQLKPMLEEKSPLFQIAYADDARDMRTYEQISRIVPIRKFRIISEYDLKKQEFFYEKSAHESN